MTEEKLLDLKDKILKSADKRTLLEALAEESAELSKAALKLIRAEKLSNNWTPVCEKVAKDDLIEELTDICVVCFVLGLEMDERTFGEKLRRWENRLRSDTTK